MKFLKDHLYKLILLLPILLSAQPSETELNKLLSGKNYFKQILVYDSLIKALKTNDLLLSLDCINKALELASKNNNDTLVAKTLSGRSKIYRRLSEFDKAEADLNTCLPIFIKYQQKTWIATVYTDLGILYYNKGIYNTSISYYLKSLKIAEEINDKNTQANLYNNIGSVFYFQQKFDKAISYYLKAYEMLDAIGDIKNAALTLDNIGIIYMNNKEYEKALQYQMSALDIIIKLNDKHFLAEIYMNMGSLFSEMKNYDRALEYYKKSFALYEEIGSKSGMAGCLSNLGDVHRAKHDYKEAIKLLTEGYQMSKEVGSTENSKVLASTLSETYEEMGQHAMALKYYKELSQLKDTVNSQESINQINELTTKFETKQKQKEIELLTKDKELNSIKLDKKNTLNTFLFICIGLVGVMLTLLTYRYKEKQKANDLLEEKNNAINEQKQVVEEKNKEITDSINYAKRIQYALLAHKDLLAENLTDFFVYFNPKDIVSGDFYWATKKGDKFYIAVCDSTGHGVPGAFMSLLSIGFLTEAINEKRIEQPNEVLNFVRQRLIDNINKDGQRDGFDGILLCIDKKTRSITYAAAHNAPIVVNSNELIELPADRMPVGIGERKETFCLHTIQPAADNMLYLYTDGFADQFGGPKGKKFKYKQLNDHLKFISKLPVDQQKENLISTFESWKGNLEQVDDVCIIGIRL